MLPNKVKGNEEGIKVDKDEDHYRYVDKIGTLFGEDMFLDSFGELDKSEEYESPNRDLVRIDLEGEHNNGTDANNTDLEIIDFADETEN